MSGTIPLALSQQMDGNGKPLAGAMLYFFQVGTVATPQNSYQDYGLSLLNPNPLVADQNGRIPMFWLADGQIHARLTDPSGVVLIDTTMLVLGPSSGGGGGGSVVDPTAIFSTGDFKWRPTSETLAGWVKANAQTIGSATSGATQRANSDTLSLYSWLWNNFSNVKCPVTGGRGASAAADFAANKTIQLPDLRGRSPFGLDDMGSSAAGRILASNVTSSGDGVTTPYGSGGEANHILTVAELASHSHSASVSDGGHNHAWPYSGAYTYRGGGGGGMGAGGQNWSIETHTNSSTTGIGVTVGNTGDGAAHNTMPPFVLGSWFVKL